MMMNDETTSKPGITIPPIAPLPVFAPPAGLGPMLLPADYALSPVALLDPPRVWSALLVPLLAILVSLVAASVAIVAAAVVHIGADGLKDHDALMAWVKSYGATPTGFLVMVLPGQLTFLSAALGAAMLSPVPLAERLGFVRPAVRWWTIPLLLPATLFAGMCGDLLTSLLFGDTRSEHLDMIYSLFRGPTGLFLVLVTLSLSVLPGLIEEMLFRGYAQRRLLRRWHPAAAVSVSGLMFAGAHIDPTHVVGVLPLGIWLGVVAWMSRSIWPSILCHTVNNAVAVLLVNKGIADPNEHVRLNAEGLITLGVTGSFAAAAVWAMWRFKGGRNRGIKGRMASDLLP